jgi:hypothetical protein
VLTVKLQNKATGRTTIVECVSVDVVPRGDDITLETQSPDHNNSYTVRAGGDYDMAFIENAAGATTQIVRPMNGHGNAQRPRQVVR